MWLPVLFFLTATVSLTQTPPAELLLSAGDSTTLTRETQPGDLHRLRILLASGQFVPIEIESQAISVTARLFYPNGRPLAQISILANAPCAGSLSLITGPAGDYRLEIESPETSSATGRYTLRVGKPRQATQPDRDAVGAAGRWRALEQPLAEFSRKDRVPEAVGYARQSLEAAEAAFGIDSCQAARAQGILASLYRRQGRFKNAEPLSTRALAIWEDTLGPAHPLIGSTLSDLGDACRGQQKHTEAEQYYLRSLELLKTSVGDEHPSEARNLDGLAEIYRAQGKTLEAEESLKRSLSIREKALGYDHPDVAVSLNSLGEFYRAEGRYDEANALLRRAMAIWENTMSTESNH